MLPRLELMSIYCVCASYMMQYKDDSTFFFMCFVSMGTHTMNLIGGEDAT